MTALALPHLGPIPAESGIPPAATITPLRRISLAKPKPPRATHRTGHCIGCHADFIAPMQSGRVPSRCPECRARRNPQKPERRLSESGSLVRTCTSCYEDFEQPRPRGHPLMKCTTCR